jgi:SAM-dependent methyltransferase
LDERLLEILRCPVTGSHLRLENAVIRNGSVISGELLSLDGRQRYSIINHIPRFVEPNNYADNFGLQWTEYRRTQLDSVSGVPISSARFYRFTQWSPEDLEGKRVLDVGCGAGRFTEIALAAGAEVIAIDYSRAVDACWENHGGNPRLGLVQADIYRLPFEPGSFDFVFCLGVLQHTPDVRGAFLALPPHLKLGGRLAVDVYPKVLRNLLWPKYWIRPFSKRVPPPQLFAMVKRWAPRLLQVSRAIGSLPLIGSKLRYAIPVANYDGVYGLSPEQLETWAVLDTFDMLAPAFDQPQTESTLREWFLSARLSKVSVERIGFVVGRGTKLTSQDA